MTFPIPDAALDDRFGWVGTAGAGKTYNAMAAEERILDRGGRIIHVDPLGVAWGFRLQPDGKKASTYNIVIIGGPHGDLPLTPNSGAVIGETVAGIAESVIVDLSELGTKAAERRFMLAFLTALYRKANGAPVHLVLDEADMWAPQQVRDKDGEAAKLLGMTETIVRRGRIKGFIPWLITQRPAVLNKDVLSQVDALVALKLTSSQDRAAIGAWIEGQADRATGKDILGSLPAMQRGQGVVWIPGRSILETVQFPRKRTFDSSRTPERGEKMEATALRALDLPALKEKLAAVETEAKADDPKALRGEIARLRAQAARPVQVAADPKAAEAENRRGRREGTEAGYAAGWSEGWRAGYAAANASARKALAGLVLDVPDEAPGPKGKPAPVPYRPKPATNIPRNIPVASKANGHAAPIAARPVFEAPADELTGPQVKIIEALAFWCGLGFPTPTRAQVAAVAGYSVSSGGFNNLLGGLRTAGLIDYRAPSAVTLTPAGEALAPAPSSENIRDRLGHVISGPQAKLVDALADGRTIGRDELGELTGYSASSGGFNNLVGSLRTLGVVSYPAPGQVVIEPWVIR